MHIIYSKQEYKSLFEEVPKQTVINILNTLPNHPYLMCGSKYLSNNKSFILDLDKYKSLILEFFCVNSITALKEQLHNDGVNIVEYSDTELLHNFTIHYITKQYRSLLKGAWSSSSDETIKLIQSLYEEDSVINLQGSLDNYFQLCISKVEGIQVPLIIRQLPFALQQYEALLFTPELLVSFIKTLETVNITKDFLEIYDIFNCPICGKSHSHFLHQDLCEKLCKGGVHIVT